LRLRPQCGQPVGCHPEVMASRAMSSGQVMYYFTSKEHILLETLAWRDHQDLIRTRAALAKVTGAWRQLERFIGLYLPAGPADPSWILWMEAWARAPHNRQVSQFLEELLALWRDDLAAIGSRRPGGTFTLPPLWTTSPSASPPCSTGSRSSASGKCTSHPVSTLSSWP
jgi:AcrR family transcriptional regulator